ncbi:5587_t:CDS:2, partial [Cetraspora pellucida]
NEQQTMTIRAQYCLTISSRNRQKDDGWPNKEGKVTLDSCEYKADCIHITTIDPGFRTFLTWYSPMEISMM